jgi:hypothetical protein
MADHEIIPCFLHFWGGEGLQLATLGYPFGHIAEVVRNQDKQDNKNTRRYINKHAIKT